MNNGLQQGEVTRSILFMLVTDDVKRYMENRISKVHIEDGKMNPIGTSDCRFTAW